MLPDSRKPRSPAKFAVDSFDRNTQAALGNKDDRGIEGPIHSADPVARAPTAESMDSKLSEGDFATSDSPDPGDLCQVDGVVFRASSHSECVA
jgi:hypothetical protein